MTMIHGHYDVVLVIVGTDGQWGYVKQSSETGPSGPLWGNPYRYRRHRHHNDHHHCFPESEESKCCRGLLCKCKCFIGKSALIVEATNLNICFYMLADNKPKGCSILMMIMPV